jgi:hypothetical protein
LPELPIIDNGDNHWLIVEEIIIQSQPPSIQIICTNVWVGNGACNREITNQNVTMTAAIADVTPALRTALKSKLLNLASSNVELLMAQLESKRIQAAPNTLIMAPV